MPSRLITKVGAPRAREGDPVTLSVSGTTSPMLPAHAGMIRGTPG
jgi:hypothetical protein